VVVPSLPGFGWSTPLTVTGVNSQRTADLWARLMTEVLDMSDSRPMAVTGAPS
jgi:hypothetical protein